MFDVVACPERGQVVTVIDRSVLEGADGTVGVAPVVRRDRHHVLLSTERPDWCTAAWASVSS